MFLLLLVVVLLVSVMTAAAVSIESAKKESLVLAVEAAEVKAFLFKQAEISAEKAAVAAKMEQLAHIRKVASELVAHRAAFGNNVYTTEYFSKHWRVKNALECHAHHKDCLAEAAQIQSRAMKHGKYSRKEKAARKIWVVRASYWKQQKEYWCNSTKR